MSLSRTTSQAMTHKYWTLLELLCGVLEDAYCYIDGFRALPGPKNYLPAATSPRCDESLQDN
ncbi:hypothetical protein DPMN_173430 [Dreissena polymorpha]|uniref:Uncharacterized protein n=1 Tax=Dreissena polymorpha TaxID=45954 RepID=A0A9D4E528_DREPO|nr:hypothetical protein DPMN_173430 [Dreissena polymorpha]